MTHLPDSLRLLSPAKLNLFLHITGRREDGYHLLQTLFQLLDYGDDMVFERRSDDKLVLATPLPGVDDEQHLAIKAARALQSHCRLREGVTISLNKRIPMGAGLGGGSSNAATTLLALNHLWNVQLPITKLAAIGLRLGADVPVFVHGKTAFAEGVGEQLTDCPQPNRWFIVLTPAVHVATAKVFQHQKLTRCHAIVKIRALNDGGWWQDTTNDCEAVVRTEYPDVDRAIKCLNQFAPARMTGTGSSVFGWVDNETRAREILRACSQECSGFVARGINCSPALIP